ncbi:MAG: 23S rRNA (pseudouridine(1915)-N(3))-methyltransferase RlmH [Eubacteriales bacterium]|nr:23S rRNA (pseudouridine(1915)-N(3))-methyltransferase RlmH [Eubacteriales bacterium]
MNITVICAGKLKESFWREAVGEYAKRLSRYGKVEILEAADEKIPDNASPAQEALIKEKEGQRMLALLPGDAYVIALAIEGKQPDSVELSQKLARLGVAGKSHLAFVIGGSLGLSPAVLARADELLSFSRMTFPHQLMRVILLEQVYRAFRIMKGEPYHK